LKSAHTTPVVLVDPQVIGCSIVGDEDIRPAIAIEVGAHHPQSGSGSGGQAGRDCHVLEAHALAGRPNAQVAEQPGDLSRKRGWSAVFAFPAGGGAGQRRVVLHVIDHDEVEPAIAVVVEESSRGPPRRVVQAGLFGDLGEGAVAVVQEQPHSPVAGDEHVAEAIVVHVTDGHPHAVVGDVQSGILADVLERAIRHLLEELVLCSALTAIVQQVDVQPPVVVEVEEGRSRTKRLRHEVTAIDGSCIVCEAQPDSIGHVGEPGRHGIFGRHGNGARPQRPQKGAGRDRDHRQDTTEQSQRLHPPLRWGRSA
jgi:hypothetical protein